MSGAQSISTRRAYGVQRVCRVWHRARSSVYARRQATRSPALCRRRGPIGAAPDDVLVAHIRRVLEASPFHGEGYRKAWAKLRVAGMRTSTGAGAPVDARARPPSPAARGPRAWAEGARRDHHHRGARRDVGHRHDGHRDGRRGGGLRSSWPSITARPHASGSMPPSAGTASRPWSRSARASANASGASATAWPVGCGCVTTTESNYLADDFQQEVAFFGIESSAELRAGARRQRRRGALHPHAEGESVVGAELRDDRGAPPGLARVQADVQRAVDAGEVRLPKPGPGATRPPRAGRGGVEANTVKPLSKNPEAVQNFPATPAE